MKLPLHYLLLLFSTIVFSQNYHDTQGKLEISSSGQATYTLPIAMPPSIKNVGPIINLTYASGQNGGIAGQGWNISAISNIARIATRNDIEGFVDGVDFDDNDKLALDGQRLILKSGTYWADGSTYETEVQSNVKIELKGTGADIYFITTATDGSRTWYGNFNGTNAVDLTAFYITRFEDTNGNYMTYHYTSPFGGSLCIEEIKFSANLTNPTPINSIKFNYVQAARKETAFVKGIAHNKVALLNNIEVKTNNQLFRKYQLTHFPDDGYGYQRVQQLQEFNGALEPANPVIFEYNTTPTTTDIIEKGYSNNLNFNSISLSGDFDGDGALDFIANNGMYSNLFKNSTGSVLGLPSTLLISRFSISNSGVGLLMLTATTKLNNKLNQFQSIVGINETTNSIKFRIHNLQGNAFIQSYEKNIAIVNTGTNSGCSNGTYTKSSNEYFEGDFNGDGISEVLMLSTINENKIYNWRTFGHERECFSSGPSYAGVNYSIIDLNIDSSTVQSSSGYVSISNTSLIGSDAVKLYGQTVGAYARYIADFNGDGKSDMLRIDNSNKTYKIISFKQITEAPWILIEIIGEGTLPSYSYDKLILFGDYNGDGKVDIMIPNAIDSYNWTIYYSNPKPNGASFFDGVEITTIWYHPTQSGQTYQDWTSYYAMDINKDGKSDLVSVYKNYYKPQWTINDHNTSWRVNGYTNNFGRTAGSGFAHTYDSGLRESGSPEEPTAVTSNYRYQGLNTDLVLVRGHLNLIEYYRFNKDFNVDNNLKKVTTSGGNIVDEVEYKRMESDATGFYTSSNVSNYPFVELTKLPTNFLVSKLKNTSVGIIKNQDFKYNGYVVNLNGLGSIGFRLTARSAWYQNDVAKRIWNVTENDPLLRGATTRSYSQLFATGNAFFFGGTVGFVNSNSNSFINSTSNKVYNLLLNKQTKIDYITGVTNEVTYGYDTTYSLPTSTISKNLLNGIVQGTTTTTNIFDPPGVGLDYYIGRPKSSTTVISAYGNSIETKEEFEYTNNRLTRTKKRGNTTDSKYLVEDFLYDTYGNVTKKTISTEGYSGNILNARATEFTYDTSGRFTTSVKDVEGLVSTNNSFHPLYGIVIASTNPFGLTITTEVDNWGKVKKITDFLGKSSTTTYAKSGSEYTVTTLGDDGSSSVTISDALGRTKKTGVKNIDATWSYKNIEYDFLGRKYRESEPYSSGSPTLWNTSIFDDYNRLINSVTSTGLATSITYNGTTVTGNDMFKTTSSTKNANGHVVSTSDNGGVINFTYFADGSLKTSTFEGTVIAMTYDEWGRKVSLSDPSAGTYSYTYYPTGETRTETTPKGVTTYTLDPATGKLIEKTIVGDLTNSKTKYTYNPTSKLLESTLYNDILEGSNTTYTTTYDAYNRIIKTTESNPLTSEFENQMTYDAFGRVEKQYYKATHYATGKNSSKWIKNTYKYGAQYQILDDATQAVLWQTNTVNARGQLTQGALGNGINMTNTYDQYGFVTQTKHELAGTTPVNVMTLNTVFEPLKGNLTSRSNSLFNYPENFEYDNLDRLTKSGNQNLIAENNFNGQIGSFDNYGCNLSLENNQLRIQIPNSATRVRKLLTTTAIVGKRYLVSAEINMMLTNGSYTLYEAADNSVTSPRVVIPVELNNNFRVSTYPNLYIEFNVNDYESCFDTQDCYTEYDEYGSYQVCNTYTTCDTSYGTGEVIIDDLNLYEFFIEEQTYDTKGRITANNAGTYSYTNTSKPFQNTSIALKPDANNYYQYDRNTLGITYNAFKSPVEIIEEGKDKLSFVYNVNNSRSLMYYGSLDDNKLLRPMRKDYSADGTMEIKYNKTTNTIEFLTYIGGDGYSAPMVLKSDGTTQEFLYLHRDYQGSILAITNSTGVVLEKRLFDAWGNIVKVADRNGTITTRLTLLDRGYTGHEHLQSVGLIHMNGRLYDPKLHRFLQPDNYVQDPYNTQNYNRYGYVLNNPLKYTDPSGEVIPLVAAIAIGAFISAATYTLTALTSDIPFTVGGIVQATFIGALSGAVSYGIGSMATNITQFGARLTFQALAHGTFQGMMSGVQGGNFWTGFASGALSSIASSVWAGGDLANGKNWGGAGGSWGSGDFGTIAFGTVSGGAGAALTGGNFWQGAATGLVVSGLNHTLHDENDPPNDQKSNQEKIYSDNQVVEGSNLSFEGRVNVEYKYTMVNGKIQIIEDSVNVFTFLDDYLSPLDSYRPNLNNGLEFSPKVSVRGNHIIFEAKGTHVTASFSWEGNSGFNPVSYSFTGVINVANPTASFVHVNTIKGKLW